MKKDYKLSNANNTKTIVKETGNEKLINDTTSEVNNDTTADTIQPTAAPTIYPADSSSMGVSPFEEGNSPPMTHNYDIPSSLGVSVGQDYPAPPHIPVREIKQT